MDADKKFKCGLVALAGLPNAGKSTLLNTLLDQKVSITSPKPQTTRNAITGIKTTDHYQIIFVDTPGYHAGRGKMNRAMVRKAEETILSVDVVCLLADASETGGAKFAELLEKVKASGLPVILALTKIDGRNKADVYKAAEKLSKLADFKEIIPISSQKNMNLDVLEAAIVAQLPENDPLYDKEEITTQPEFFLVAEFIREQIFLLLQQEVPYDILVETERIEESESRMDISAAIIVSRDSQKGIVIGKNGLMLKKIGTQARKELERFFGMKIYLRLWVKVREDWSSTDEYLKIQGL